MRALAAVTVVSALLASTGIAAAQAASELAVPQPPGADESAPAPSDVLPGDAVLSPDAEPVPEEEVTPDEAAAVPEVEIRWGTIPVDGLQGIRDPHFGTEMDDGIVWNGLMMLLSAYATGIATTLPWAIECTTRCRNEAFGVFTLVPLLQWMVAFNGRGEAAVGGGLASFFGLIGGIIYLAGAFHHRSALRPGPREGDVALTRDGFTVAF